ncbi:MULTISPECIES: class I SAM-dependent RNA methyltransferase [unclassified Brevundimonas]|uniref:class I SAM-dependent RNA methyltransferase n=1 Tax=unclassified Brevundimonas TaxID=2622653 RepID=UPI0025C2294F|nr:MULTISPECIES: TRAM domain-containing protein [unclassified Brevundimonas]
MTQTLTIARMGHQGDGIAETPNGFVFVPGALPGEVISGDVKDGRVEAFDLIEASPDRRPIHSETYAECGVAPLQHWADEPYLAWKREVVIQTLAREGIETEVEATVAVPQASRRRLALHARSGPGGRVLLGFKARRSWRLVELTDCPVSDPALIAALPGLAKVAAPFLGHPKSAPTLHVTLTDTGLDVDVTGVEKKSGGLTADVTARAIAAAAEAGLARLSLDGDTLVMARQPRITFGRATVPLPPAAFLQAAPAAEAAMVSRAVEAVRGAKKVADLFCGAGTFTFPLAEFASVIAADSSAASIAALKAGVSTAQGLKTIEAQARDLFRRPLSPYDLKGCEAIVIDPPRAGALEQTQQLPGTKAGLVVGVSCNPQTFARDARVLIDGGFRLEKVTPIDQFLWSTHVELVGIFRR